MRILPTPIGLSRSATYDGQRCLFRHIGDSVLEAARGGISKNREEKIENSKESDTKDPKEGNSDAERALAEIIKGQKGRGAVIDLGTGQGGTKQPEASKKVTTPPNSPPAYMPNDTDSQIKFSE